MAETCTAIGHAGLGRKSGRACPEVPARVAVLRRCSRRCSRCGADSFHLYRAVVTWLLSVYLSFQLPALLRRPAMARGASKRKQVISSESEDDGDVEDTVTCFSADVSIRNQF